MVCADWLGGDHSRVALVVDAVRGFRTERRLPQRMRRAGRPLLWMIDSAHTQRVHAKGLVAFSYYEEGAEDIHSVGHRCALWAAHDVRSSGDLQWQLPLSSGEPHFALVEEKSIRLAV